MRSPQRRGEPPARYERLPAAARVQTLLFTKGVLLPVRWAIREVY